MSIKVEGLDEAQRALDDALKRINVVSEEMLAVMLQAISANTKPYVPVDPNSGALINSEDRKTWQGRNGPEASISYGGEGESARGTPVQEYAEYVHEGPQKNWQKPGASNRFLAKGVEDFLRDDADKIVRRYESK